MNLSKRSMWIQRKISEQNISLRSLRIAWGFLTKCTNLHGNSSQTSGVVKQTRSETLPRVISDITITSSTPEPHTDVGVTSSYIFYWKCFIIRVQSRKKWLIEEVKPSLCTAQWWFRKSARQLDEVRYLDEER